MRDPTAVLGRRFLALVIDVVIILLLTGLFAPDALRSGVARGVNLCPPGEGVPTEEPAASGGQICTRGGRLIVWDGTDSTYVDFGGAVGWLLVLVLVTVGVYLLEGATGRTPGKALVGIATVTADGTPAGAGRGLLRWLVSIVDWIPYACGPVVGGIVVLATDDHRRLADYAAGTFVVHKGAVGTPLALQKTGVGTTPPPASYPTPYSPDATPPFQTPHHPGPPAAVPTGPAPTPPPGFMAPQWDERWTAWMAWNTAESRWYRYDPSSRNWIPV